MYCWAVFREFRKWTILQTVTSGPLSNRSFDGKCYAEKVFYWSFFDGKLRSEVMQRIIHAKNTWSIIGIKRHISTPRRQEQMVSLEEMDFIRLHLKALGVNVISCTAEELFKSSWNQRYREPSNVEQWNFCHSIENFTTRNLLSDHLLAECLLQYFSIHRKLWKKN